MEREKILKIKIKTGISAKYDTENYKRKLHKVEGRWVEVDTEYLFTSQFNTKPIPGITESGLRIYGGDVDIIENDERIGRSRCGYCGLWATTGEPCKGCTKGTEQMIEFFPGTKRDFGMQDEVSSMLDNIIGI